MGVANPASTQRSPQSAAAAQGKSRRRQPSPAAHAKRVAWGHAQGNKNGEAYRERIRKAGIE